jgi:hypothetical protein
MPRKGPSYRAGGSRAKLLRAQGVPTRYWSVTTDEAQHLRQRTFSIEIPRPWAKGGASRYISPARQQSWIDELFADRLTRSAIIAIGSEPTDELAMTLAASMLERARQLKLKPLCLSIQRAPGEQDVALDGDVVVLHNLTAESHQVRTQFCRDWLDWFDDSARIVVIGGQDPYRFFHQRLRLPLDYGLYLCGERHENI